MKLSDSLFGVQHDVAFIEVLPTPELPCDFPWLRFQHQLKSKAIFNLIDTLKIDHSLISVPASFNEYSIKVMSNKF